MSTQLRIASIQKKLGLADDGVIGPKTLDKLESIVDLYVQSFPPPAKTEGMVLKGDGTWPFTARVDGDDIVVENVKATCFGGSSDPQDNGDTASGMSTKTNPLIQAVSLPMDGRQFPGMSAAEHRALDGSPIPRLPWHTMVEVTANGKLIRPNQGVIDLGPGKQATRPGSLAHAIDLTVAAARLIDPKASATNFSAVVSYRIIDGAKYIK